MPLPDDSTEKWIYTEHTKVKHEILSKYIDGWIKILGKEHNLNILDCFAGRGEYMDERGDKKEGSPTIILKRLAEIRERMQRPREACCIFIENNKNNFDNLRTLVDREQQDYPERYRGWLKVYFHNDEFANVAESVMREYGCKLAPSFFFVDPFGFGIPFKIIKRILSIEKTEVLINFMVRDVNRFLESPQHQHSIEELYGMNDVLGALLGSYSHLPREQALLKLYRDRLHQDAKTKYTFPFKVNADQRLQTTYYLIHCTNHPLGCELMKEIMFKTGTEGRFAYLGPAEGQMSLSYYEGENELKNFLLKRFAGRSLSFEDVYHETLMETDFIKKHYRKAIKELEEEGRISIEGKGPRGGIDNATITF